MKEKDVSKKNGREFLKDWRFWAGLIAFAIVGQVLGGIAGNNQAKQELQQENKQNYGKVISDTGLTEAHRESHIKGCMQVGSNKEYCTCTFDEIKNQYTPESLKAAADETKNTGKIPEPMINAYNACQYLR